MTKQDRKAADEDAAVDWLNDSHIEDDLKWKYGRLGFLAGIQHERSRTRELVEAARRAYKYGMGLGTDVELGVALNRLTEEDRG